jgi:hypothetical protein
VETPEHLDLAEELDLVGGAWCGVSEWRSRHPLSALPGISPTRE